MTAFVIQRPPDGIAALPLVFDSPHSGTVFPDGFSTPAATSDLKTAWDAHVEDLWSAAVDDGATLIAATFPRVVVDANRAPDDIDPALLDGPWPPQWGTLNPTRYSARGMGLLRRDILPGQPMHHGLLDPLTVKSWIDTLHAPYHAALDSITKAFRLTLGNVWHINCHSMKSAGNAMNIDVGKPRPDIVLGDLDGTSAAPDFTQYVKSAFVAAGFTVSVNNPYKGGYLVQRHGRPEQGIHSLQIEINRALYLDESTAEKSPDYPAFKSALSAIGSSIAAFVRSNMELA